jgi:dipeptidyl aminopeptidase/acylaminoacyl peptidase
VFPEEHHQPWRSGKPSRRVQRFEEQLAWFDRFLKARGCRRRRGARIGR